MTLTFELDHAQEALLHRRAAEAGQDPADYLLTAAGIVPNFTDEAEVDANNHEPRTAYDRFKPLLGGWGSEGGRASEATGDVFAEGMAEKRKQGHL